jgi:hypothetical protein
MVGRLDLDDLREQVRQMFLDYDCAVYQRNTPEAYRLKMKITNTAVAALDRTISRGACGLYVFVGNAPSIERYRYIGMACPGTIRERIKKRFQDETCLDQSLYKEDRHVVWNKAYRRICVSMDQRGNRTASTPQLKLRYAFQHTKTLGLLKHSSEILVFACFSDKHVVNAAESLLIYAGTSLGAPLLNIQERDNLVANLKPGEDLAFEVMRQLPEADQWVSAASEILERFGGTCC